MLGTLLPQTDRGDGLLSVAGRICFAPQRGARDERICRELAAVVRWRYGSEVELASAQHDSSFGEIALRRTTLSTPYERDSSNFAFRVEGVNQRVWCWAEAGVEPAGANVAGVRYLAGRRVRGDRFELVVIFCGGRCESCAGGRAEIGRRSTRQQQGPQDDDVFQGCVRTWTLRSDRQPEQCQAQHGNGAGPWRSPMTMKMHHCNRPANDRGSAAAVAAPHDATAPNRRRLEPLVKPRAPMGR